jgi:superfamily II DNA or RNA helicase
MRNRTSWSAGTLVLYNDIEYFVVKETRKDAPVIPLRRRFKPYVYRAVAARKSQIIFTNVNARRLLLQEGDFIFYDFDSFAVAKCYITGRFGDTISFQALGVGYTFSESIYSNLISICPGDPIDYIPRVPSLSSNLLQARVSLNNAVYVVVDYEPMSDRYLLQDMYRDGIWVKRSEFEVDFADQDTFDCEYENIGKLKFSFNDLFSVGISYDRSFLREVDNEAIKRNIWYQICVTRYNHFGTMSAGDFDIFCIILWLENHEYYWKKQCHVYTDSINYYDTLLESILSDGYSDELLVYIGSCTGLSQDIIARAERIKNKLRSKPMFKTKLEFVDGVFHVDILAPVNCHLRSKGMGSDLMFRYTSKVLWHLSNKPSACSWIESRRKTFKLTPQRDRVELKIALKPFQESVLYEMRYREMHGSMKDLISLNTTTGLNFNAVSCFDNDYECNGGILSLPTGTGKTICTLALIKQGIELYNIKQTLIVLPLSLIDQWISELQRFTDLTYGEIHGRKDTSNNKNVVFTTYGTVLSKFNNFDTRIRGFDRVVFDESHQLKGFNSITVRACSRVYAKYRWCLSATPYRRGPLQNVQSQLCLLNIRPFSTYHDHLSGILGNETPQTKWIMSQLSSIVINPDIGSLGIPESHHEYIWCNSYTAELYNLLLEKIKGEIYDKSHKQMLTMINYLSICASNPAILNSYVWGERCAGDDFSITNMDEIQKTLSDKSGFAEEVQKTLENIDEATCCLCLENMTRPTITECLHMFCHDCIKRSLEFNDKCPCCRKRLNTSSFREITTSAEVLTSEDGCVYVYDQIGRKIKVPTQVIELRKNTYKNDKLEKLKLIIARRNRVIVFSQFNMVLENFAQEFSNASILTGKSTRRQRHRNLEKFKSGEHKIFFLSTKVADIGINLTEADTLVFLEPGLDSSVETQAIGRLKRIGQEQEVHVYTMATLGTIEENIESEKANMEEKLNALMISNMSKTHKNRAKKRIGMDYIINLISY